MTDTTPTPAPLTADERAAVCPPCQAGDHAMCHYHARRRWWAPCGCGDQSHPPSPECPSWEAWRRLSDDVFDEVADIDKPSERIAQAFHWGWHAAVKATEATVDAAEQRATVAEAELAAERAARERAEAERDEIRERHERWGQSAHNLGDMLIAEWDQRITEAERERDAARAEIADANQRRHAAESVLWHAEQQARNAGQRAAIARTAARDLKRERDAARAEAAVVREALEKYGGHIDIGCHVLGQQGCVCGFRAALAPAEGEGS